MPRFWLSPTLATKIASGVPEPVVSGLVKASRQDVLENVPAEFDARQPLDVPPVGVSVFPKTGRSAVFKPATNDSAVFKALSNWVSI